MLLRKFPLDGHGALYEQLARVLKRAILEGHFRPGERLPATRALATTLGLSRNTVITAYEILRAEQLTNSGERFGTRVARMSLPAGFNSTPPVKAPPQSRVGRRLRSRAAAPLLFFSRHGDGNRVHRRAVSWLSHHRHRPPRHQRGSLRRAVGGHGRPGEAISTLLHLGHLRSCPWAGVLHLGGRNRRARHTVCPRISPAVARPRSLGPDTASLAHRDLLGFHGAVRQRVQAQPARRN